MQFSLEDAAKLAEASYKTSRITSPAVTHSCPHRDVQAHMLEGGILLLPGSNSVRDYLKFNLRPLRVGHRRLKLSEEGAENGASGTKWHQGFLAYSREVFEWLKTVDQTPNYIIGHSLGAAAAQILAKTYDVPAIGFAGPRPKFARGRVNHDRQCLLVNRGDDPVPKLPTQFFHVATVKKLSPKRDDFGLAHSMRHYREIVEEGIDANRLPKTWAGA